MDTSGDTLHISERATIKYIKIGDIVYEIKRTTTIEKVEQTTIYGRPEWQKIIPVDSSFNHLYLLNTFNQQK
jgi:hypothetical protein